MNMPFNPYQNGQAPASTSLNTLVMQNGTPPIRELGHEYHCSDKILTPSDPTEYGLLVFQHELFRKCFAGHLTLCPIYADEKIWSGRFFILDIGTGSGAWAIEMANRFPNAFVNALDITLALVPGHLYLPRNIRFEMADVTHVWGPMQYDFIYMRDLISGGIRDWRSLLEMVATHLQPGGRVEFVQLDSTLSEIPGLAAFGPVCREHRKLLQEACQAQGVDFDPAPKVKACLETLPRMFHITQVTYHLPTKTHGVSELEKVQAELVLKILPHSKF